MSLTKVKAGNILLTTPSASSNDVTPATTQYVTTALANMVDSAPSTLNTLNELAAALGDDANFSTTVTNSIAAKLPLAGGTLTGTLTTPTLITGAYGGSGSAGDGFRLNSTDLYGQIDASDKIRLNVNGDSFLNGGNLGIGVVPTANWHANATALQISPIGAIWNTSNYEDFNIGNNVYTDGTEKYIQNDAACKIRLTDAGLMDFRVAGAGTAGNAISFTTALSIEATGNTMVGKGFAVRGTQVPSYGKGIEMHQSGDDMHIYAYDRDNSAVKDLILQNPGGNVGIGTSSPDRLLDVSGTGNVYGKFQSTNTTGAGIQVKDASEDWLIQADGGPVDGLAFYDLGRSAYRMVIDDGGNVGIGTSSPSNKLEISGTGGTRLKVENTDTNWAGLDLTSGGNQANYVFFRDNSAERARITVYDGNDMAFSTGSSPSEKMRIASNGRLFLMTSASGSGALNIMGEVGNSYDAVQFYHTNTTIVGRIRTAASSTSYITSSDYRLKENIDYTWDATTRLKQLKPTRFNWIADDTNTLVDGFLAHEVSSVVPEAITGTKDEVDSDGQPVLQGIDHSKLVPLLVKTIQELEARIATLEG